MKGQILELLGKITKKHPPTAQPFADQLGRWYITAATDWWAGKKDLEIKVASGALRGYADYLTGLGYTQHIGMIN